MALMPMTVAAMMTTIPSIEKMFTVIRDIPMKAKVV
jgi:hypothetical protein